MNQYHNINFKKSIIYFNWDLISEVKMTLDEEKFRIIIDGDARHCYQYEDLKTMQEDFNNFRIKNAFYSNHL